MVKILFIFQQTVERAFTQSHQLSVISEALTAILLLVQLGQSDVEIGLFLSSCLLARVFSTKCERNGAFSVLCVMLHILGTYTLSCD